MNLLARFLKWLRPPGRVVDEPKRILGKIQAQQIHEHQKMRFGK
jgi:hypothetical protein